ncbi:MAG: hypothetical protein RMH97_09060, partial [Verrucomicrobiales bacterium]|nr:hypothetical protein [Verrucomicrobiales bacterium]
DGFAPAAVMYEKRCLMPRKWLNTCFPNKRNGLTPLACLFGDYAPTLWIGDWAGCLICLRCENAPGNQRIWLEVCR